MLQQIELLLLILLVSSLVVWLLVATSRSVHHRRISIIREEVLHQGGDLISVTQVPRSHCELSPDYHDVGKSYKFYRVSYRKGTQTHQGWAVITMEQNYFGPNGAIRSSWHWQL